jgi:N4-gp56 family major capsid protein
MTITTSSVLPAPVQQSFSYKLLAVPTPYFIFKTAAMLKQMPRNGGTTLRMRRYNPLPTSTVPLGNSGITPPPVQLTALDIDAKIEFYGQYILLNEQVTLQNQDPVSQFKAGVKSSLIDLNLLRDNKAQAEAEMLLAA